MIMMLIGNIWVEISITYLSNLGQQKSDRERESIFDIND